MNLNQAAEYINNRGILCPHCRHNRTRRTGEATGLSEIHVYRACEGCGCTWMDRFVLAEALQVAPPA